MLGRLKVCPLLQAVPTPSPTLSSWTSPRRDRTGEESYLADSRLEYGIEAALGGIAVPGHPLLPNFLVEAVDSVCERQQVAEPKGRDAVWE